MTKKKKKKKKKPSAVRPHATEHHRKVAEELYGSDDIEVDADAVISETDDGVWVQGWLWVSNEELAS